MASLTKEQLPWNVKPLDMWRIVGMNHYISAGVKCLFVAMTNDIGQCIVSEGTNEVEVFRALWVKADRIERKMPVK